jgi:hypothetical protein
VIYQLNGLQDITGAGVGGAIVKDKTFYYLNFEHTTDVKEINLLNVHNLVSMKR